MTAIYNENEPFAVRWLEGLIANGHIAPGRVDSRSIADLAAADVAGTGQRHFFAGIAGWSLALRLAGVPDDASVWTGSCPCQPLSDAGRRRGFDDERHLWPVWFRLIAECRPAVVFGEQVASGLGRSWLDLVFADMEGVGYACAAADLPAAGAGAPHERQRLFFVAYADGEPGRLLLRAWRSRQQDAQARRSGEAGELADANGRGRDGGAGHVPSRPEQPDAAGSGTASVADATGSRRRAGRPSRAVRDRAQQPSGLRPSDSMGDAVGPGLEVQRQQPARREQPTAKRAGAPRDFWSPCDWIPCSDGVSRPVEPIAHAMADGLPPGMGRVRTDIVSAIEKEVNDELGEVGAREALLDLQGALEAQAIQWSTRRPHGVQEPAFLLAFVRQLAEQGWSFAQRLQRAGQETQAQRMRMLRRQDEASRASRERGLDGQPSSESSDAVRVLSSILARHAQAAWGEAFATRAAATHPLAIGVPGRVGLLRGYGNAIIPQVAAAFIVAALEAAHV